MKIFDLDGPFQKYGSMVFDLLALNIIWLLLSVFSLGILSGPALTGLYAGTYASLVSGEGYAFKQFFRRFKSRLFTALLVSLFCFFFIGISIANIYLILQGIFGTIWFLPFYLFILLEISFIATYAYPLLAHSDLKAKELIKTAFFLSNRHLPTTILSTALNVAAILIIIIAVSVPQYFLANFVIMALVTFLNGHLITKRILTQYDTIFVSVDH